MKIQNNKGFSLIELMIAVAVMTILITPIISQLFTTVKVSGEAKEKQYVVESVDNTLENFRTFDENKLVDIGAGKKEYTDPVLGRVVEDWKGTVSCHLYKATKNPSTGVVTYTDTTKSVNYNQVNYTLDSIGLGISKSNFSDKKNYSRLITKSDLNNKLAEQGYQIDYSFTASDDIKSDASAPSNIERRSDNTVGVIDSNECFTSIVVKDSTGTQKDPNTVSVSNLQNIDASSIAIIQSDATTLDYDIEKAVSATLVTYASDPKNSGTTLGKMSKNPKELNEDIKDIINNPYSMDKSRSIHLTVTVGHDAGGVAKLDSVTDKPLCYHVRCDVVYRVAFKGASADDVIKPYNNYTSEVGYYSFNVLDRDYYTDKPTNVYMIYEPLLLSTKGGTRTFYADRDYIDITTDEYTDGTKVYPDGSKLKASSVYLIGSSTNWAKATNTPRDPYRENVDGVTVNYNMYRTYFNGTYRDVNIVVNGTPGGQPIDIYTNIGVGFKDPDGSYKKNDTDYYGHLITRQFRNNHDVSTYFDKPPVYKSDMSTSIGTPVPYGTLSDGDDSNIKPYYLEDVKEEGRLYQVTVVYTNLSSNEKTYITGAKGAN